MEVVEATGGHGSLRNRQPEPSETKLILSDYSQEIVGSIINPQGFSKDGEHIKGIP